jgi:BCD family chlorophyll transporter-like MFS transporter
MMRMASEGRTQREGVRMGLWGASQAIAFGIGGLTGALASDIARQVIANTGLAYGAVFAAEALLFLWAAALAGGIETESRPRRARRSLWTSSTPTMPS